MWEEEGRKGGGKEGTGKERKKNKVKKQDLQCEERKKCKIQ